MADKYITWKNTKLQDLDSPCGWDELFADKVSVGQDAWIRNQGDTEIIAKGKIVVVGNYLKKKSLFSGKPDDLEDRRVREVRVELGDKANVLIGARVECVIQLK